MRDGFLGDLACPYCEGALQAAEVSERRGEEVWSGALACEACEASFAVRDGMAFVHRGDESWEAMAREAEGWVAIHKQKGIYEPSAEAVDLQIPYYEQEPWIGVAERFDQALSYLKLTGEETVLDLGAGRGWAAKQFALLGCETTALDVTWDHNIGLGRGRALMDDAGVFFERVIGDGEHLPFQPQTFDLVFCSAALHHAQDLPLVMHNVARVLKPGGRLCAIREPALSAVDDAAAEMARAGVEEAEFGINETRPTYEEYVTALREAGLQPEVIPGPALAMSDEDAQAWARDLGAVWAWPDWRAPKRSVWRLWAYTNRRARALRRGRLQAASRVESIGERERALEAVARWCTGEVFVMGRRLEIGD